MVNEYDALVRVILRMITWFLIGQGYADSDAGGLVEFLSSPDLVTAISMAVAAIVEATWARKGKVKNG